MRAPSLLLLVSVSGASLQLWDVDGMASVYHPHERTVSITAELEVQGFLMKDAPERLELETLPRALLALEHAALRLS